MNIKKNVILIVGPTGIGKTGLSLRLAESLPNVEIVSADSRQVFKMMDIGTAKPDLNELQKVKHHFIDIVFPDEYYSAGKYGRQARRKIDSLFQSNATPIVVGGSGLYIQALVDGFFEREVFDSLVKEKLKKIIDKKGVEHLYQKLLQIDSASAKKIHPNDAHRIVRALEVYELTGQPLSEFQQEKSTPADFEPFFIGLNRGREKLYQIIEERVDSMLRQGLVDEVKKIQQSGYTSELNSLKTVGYREIFDFLNGKIDYDEAVRLIKQRSRNYAKRQLTWFRKDQRIHWINVDDYKGIDVLTKHVLEIYDRHKQQ